MNTSNVKDATYIAATTPNFGIVCKALKYQIDYQAMVLRDESDPDDKLIASSELANLLGFFPDDDLIRFAQEQGINVE
jgi:hypothetical protein